jgi:hypothetical protein
LRHKLSINRAMLEAADLLGFPHTRKCLSPTDIAIKPQDLVLSRVESRPGFVHLSGHSLCTEPGSPYA